LKEKSKNIIDKNEKKFKQLFHTFVPNVKEKRSSKYLMFSSQVKKKALGGFTSKMWKKIFQKKKGKNSKWPLNTFVPNVEDKISSGWLIHSFQEKGNL
jgi:hypothetical protein